MSKKKNRDVIRQIRKNSKRGISPLEMLAIQESARKHTKKMQLDATEDAFRCMLAIPLNVLVNDYWSKTAKRKAPEFIDEVIKLFNAFVDGYVSREEMDDLLWEYAGIKITSEGVEKYDSVAKRKASKAADRV